mgnify:FL=1
MAALLTTSLILPLLIGFSLSLFFLPPGDHRITPLLRVFLGAGAGIGVVSLAGFCFLFIRVGSSFFLREFALAAFGAALVWSAWRKGILREAYARAGGTTTRDRKTLLTPLALAITALSAAATFAIAVYREPHGKWDAFLIWNMHARFLFRSGENWMDYFRSGLDWTHPDYPCLLPLSIVRVWEYCGGETLAAPIAIALLFTLLVAGLLWTALGTLRNNEQGCLAAMLLAASPLFVLVGASQLADIPLSFFILGAIVVLFLHDRLEKPGSSAVVMAGLLAGLAAWTKNEGILFCSLILLVRPVITGFYEGPRRAAGEFVSLFAGAAPALLVLFLFKTAIAPPSDLLAGQTAGGFVERLGDAGRYGTVLMSYLRTGLTFTQGIPDVRAPFVVNPFIPGFILLAAYLALSGIEKDPRDGRGFLTGWAVVALTLAGYFFVFIMTPHDLKWHLLTALNRLFLQFWPAVIFLVFMAARGYRPAPAEESPGERQKGSRKAPRKQKKGRKE